MVFKLINILSSAPLIKLRSCLILCANRYYQVIIYPCYFNRKKISYIIIPFENIVSGC